GSDGGRSRWGGGRRRPSVGGRRRPDSPGLLGFFVFVGTRRGRAYDLLKIRPAVGFDRQIQANPESASCDISTNVGLNPAFMPLMENVFQRMKSRFVEGSTASRSATSAPPV